MVKMKFDDKILVTGASGFIGSHVLRLLYQRGYMNLRAVVHTRGLRNDFKGSQNIETITGDLRNAEFCAKVTEGVDVVFHCAANTSNALDTKFNPLLHVTPNVEMAVNLLEQSWKSKVRKFLYVSSNTVYPDLGDEDCAEWMDVHATPLIPVYKGVGGMKRYGELLCDFFSNQIHNPMDCIIVRPSNAFGPNDKFDYEKCHVTPANIRKVADGLNPIPVWGDGTEMRDLLHVEDMADAFIYIMEKCDTYDIYNVAYGEAYSVNTVLGWLKDLENNTNPISYVNNKAPMVPIRKLSSKKINKLGWTPKRDLKEALKETIEWYKNNKHQFNPDSKP
jgi:GDP-L-fucose synthase